MTINAINKTADLVVDASGNRSFLWAPSSGSSGYSGGTLTLVGTFPSKPTAAPFFFEDFESYTVGTVATSCGLVSLGGDGTMPVISTVRAYSGTKALRVDYATGDQSRFPRLGIQGLSATEVYISGNIYYELHTNGASTSTPILKLCRAGSAPVYTGAIRCYETLRPAKATGLVGSSDRGIVTSNGVTEFSGIDGSSHRDQWNRIEYRYKLSAAGGTDGVFQTWHNLVVGDAASTSPAGMPSTAATTRGATQGALVIEEVMSFFDGMDRYGIDNGYYLYMDNFYVDTTCIRVEVGDAPTLAACTKRVIAVPSSWTTTEIIASLDVVALGSGTRYAFIFDSSNNQYGESVAITI